MKRKASWGHVTPVIINIVLVKRWLPIYKRSTIIVGSPHPSRFAGYTELIYMQGGVQTSPSSHPHSFMVPSCGNRIRDESALLPILPIIIFPHSALGRLPKRSYMPPGPQKVLT